MASKRRSRTVDIRVNYPTRRAKSSRQAKKVEDKKLISEQKQTTKAKNVIREIEKPKSHTDKKPQESRAAESSKQLKQKKIHKCSICSKVFKGVKIHLLQKYNTTNSIHFRRFKRPS